jgi:hypothetical protein
MYHSVADSYMQIPYGHLIHPTYQFERCIKYLHDNRYVTIGLDELYQHLRFQKSIPDKSIILTFDDGYLDNWVFVYPILKKYKMKGTIFVSPEFVDTSSLCRPNLDDVERGEIQRKSLKFVGFLSWEEMRVMEASGVMDIQCHTLSHTRYFCSDRIIDFHHPGDNYDWLWWNRFPEKKYRWGVESQQELLGFGTPVYENGRSLAIRRYYEDLSLNAFLVGFVKDHGEKAFFQNSRWKSILLREANDYRHKHNGTGRYETQSEYQKRLHLEIVESKRLIEEKLSKKVNFLCWAGGAFTDESLDLAMKSDYLATSKGTQPNAIGSVPSRFHRINPCLDNQMYPPFIRYVLFLPFFIMVINRYRGKAGSDAMFKISRSAFKAARRWQAGFREMRKRITN